MQEPKRKELPGGERGRSPRSTPFVWYDSARRGATALSPILSRLGNAQFDAVLLYPQNIGELAPLVPPRLRQVVHVEDVQKLQECCASGVLQRDNQVVASYAPDVLDRARQLGFPCCLRARVHDGASLAEAVERGQRYPWLLLAIRDTTNIPLELAIATLQPTDTRLIKEIEDPRAIDDAVVCLGVMEVGADGVMFSPSDGPLLDSFIAKVNEARKGTLALQSGTIVRSVPVGMGHRSCVDLVTICSPAEGMIVGSTSQGGVLCCPEVFHLPYMDLRPFRINAGAIHSYVWSPDSRTNYLSELRSGSPAMVVGVDGTTRLSVVGRIKTEVRPLRLLEVEFDGGERINAFLQDDWHVRIFSADARPLNITEIEVGDRVLGHVASPGRHVGIKIEETIIEQ